MKFSRVEWEAAGRPEQESWAVHKDSRLYKGRLDLLDLSA